jgi:hypothetical protein
MLLEVPQQARQRHQRVHFVRHHFSGPSVPLIGVPAIVRLSESGELQEFDLALLVGPLVMAHREVVVRDPETTAPDAVALAADKMVSEMMGTAVSLVAETV